MTPTTAMGSATLIHVGLADMMNQMFVLPMYVRESSKYASGLLTIAHGQMRAASVFMGAFVLVFGFRLPKVSFVFEKRLFQVVQKDVLVHLEGTRMKLCGMGGRTVVT